MATIEFNPRFMEALDLLENSTRHVFITGRAGTGKSTLLQHFRATTKKNPAVLAPTGVAAVNIRGETLHSFFRFKPGVTLEEARKIGGEFRRSDLFKALKMIVIDEISMVRADLLDCVSEFLKKARASKSPFGGVQMAFIGDLYQLPPVVSGAERDIFKTTYRSPYFFDAEVLKEVSSGTAGLRMALVELEKIYRQHDEEFIGILNAIRNKNVTDAALSLLNRRVAALPDEESRDCIHLTSTNAQADAINLRNLEALPAPLHRFEGVVEGEFDRKSLPTDPDLALKEGARVMLLNNDSQGRWVNGTLGTVTGLRPDQVLVRIDGGWEEEIEPVTWNLFRSYYNKESRSIDKEDTGRFTQIPLRLAWAITIHKSQGKTFDRVAIDLGRGAFSHGQVYVALSRCRSLEGIVLKAPVQRKHIMMDFQVVRFLTGFQYRLSDEKMPLHEKVARIQSAIEEKKTLRITYLKSRDEKSNRVILPLRTQEMEYRGKRFLGLEAYCFSRDENRTFRVDRILDIADAV